LGAKKSKGQINVGYILLGEEKLEISIANIM
jgi:hypothetical protein